MAMAMCRVLLVMILVSTLYPEYTLTQNSAVFTVTPGNIIAKLGFPARLDCQTNAPDTFIRWSRLSGGGENLIIDFTKCNCQVLSNSSLYFNETTLSIGGEYACFTIGNSSAQSNGSITIAVKPSITPRGFTITRNQNDTFRLNISVTGIPQPDVIWLKDSANFTSELTGVTVSTSGLQITNAQYRTAGRYSVQATNCASSELQIYDIFIRFLPVVRMISNTDSVEVAVGTVVTVTCSVTSYPGSSIHWEQQTSTDYVTLNSFVVRSNTSYMFSVITNSTITFMSSDINGASSYCCAATNMVGTTVNCLHFTERGVPSGFKVIERTPNSVTVQWDPAPLGGVTYKLQYRVENSNDQWMVRQLQNSETNYTLNNLKPNTSYTLMISSLRNTIPSSSTMITVRTRISVPGDIPSFKVDSTLIPGIFVLTWQAPKESVVDCYIVHIRWDKNNHNTIKVDGTKTSLNINNLTENVEYMFSMQAVNDGGSGNITSYKSGIFCLTKPTINTHYILQGTTVNISWDLSDSVYSSRNVMLVVAEPSKVIFTTELINASYRHYCISNLRPNTRYEIKVNAILGCDNVSNELDILTQFAISDTNFNCIILNLTNAENTIGKSNSTTLEAWIIILVVISPLLAVTVMLSIGMYCACKKRYIPNKDLELLPRTSSSLNYHTTNYSTNNFTNRTTSRQSQSSHVPRQNQSVQAGTTQ